MRRLSFPLALALAVVVGAACSSDGGNQTGTGGRAREEPAAPRERAAPEPAATPAAQGPPVTQAAEAAEAAEERPVGPEPAARLTAPLRAVRQSAA